MKILLAGLSLATSGVLLTPILALNNIQKQGLVANQEPEGYKSYQSESNWYSYIASNTQLQSIVTTSFGLTGYHYNGTTLKIKMLDDKPTQPIGTLLMNGNIETTVGSPSLVTQHVVDNQKGKNPITVNYDSNEVTTTTTIAATFSTSLSTSITTSESVDLWFASANVSATLAFNLSASLSTTNSVQQKITFDKFSTTVPMGEREEIDYVVMQNINKFNMVLKTKVDLDNSNFVYINDNNQTKTVSFYELLNNKFIGQAIAIEFETNNRHLSYDMGFISIDRINNPAIPFSNLIFDVNNVFMYLPMSFTIDGYSTLITQQAV